MPRVRLPTGIELHYKLGGAGEETLVFVNGLTMDTTSWRPVASRFEGRARTLRYDCRGQGESDKPEGPYRPEQHAADLVALLDVLELEQVHLVGLSNGGLVSILVAAQLGGARVRSLTTVDSFAEVDPLLRLILESWRSALHAGGPTLRFDVATPWVWGHTFVREHLDEVRAYREKAAQASLAAVEGLIGGLLGFEDAFGALQSYEGPVLALVGEEDVLTPVRYSRAVAEGARRGRLEVLPRAGHGAPIERPDAVAQAVEAFISTV